MKNYLKHHILLGLLWAGTLLFMQCLPKTSTNQEKPKEENHSLMSATIKKSDFGIIDDSIKVEKFTLKNINGIEIDIITYGGIITSWKVPDQNGRYENIVLGYDKLSQYVESNPYFGAIIGRYGNRIAKGQFTLEGETYQLETNNAPNHLHGGIKGFDKVVWSAKGKEEANAASLKLSYLSKDMEAGYPGKLNCSVIYTLTADNTLTVNYEATTDKTTIINLTQHSYFNLSGDFSTQILDHELTIAAENFLPVDEALIPTGEIIPVEGTPFDFRTAKLVGRDINSEHQQLARGNGYDHCWVLDKPGSMRKVASAYHAKSGRLLEVFSDEPGIQFYSGNFLDGSFPIPGGGYYSYRAGFCLETQHFPDSPNQEEFPSVILKAGETYKSQTAFKFTTKSQ